MSRILIVEDEKDLASLLERTLREEGFDVSIARTGEEGMRQLSKPWDLVLLDLMLPDLPGENILRFINQKLDRPPVLILTARGEVANKVELFREGCDDYLTKPFVLEELLGRIRALLRRAPRVQPELQKYEDVLLLDDRHELRIGPNPISLTPKEHAILRLLMQKPGGVVSRREMIQSVWGYLQEPSTNFIEVHLANLRKKLRPFGRDEWVQTVRSSGFTFMRPSHES